MMRFFLILIFALQLFASQKIVALSPSVNEIIFALGEGKSIVGNTTYCTYPKVSQSISKVGGYFSPSLEKILSLSPTLVIMQKNNYKLSQKLHQLGIKTMIVRIDTFENIKKTILSIGEVLDKEKEARKIVADIDNALQKTKNIIHNKRILVVMGHNTSLVSRIFVAGQNLYFDDIIKASGNINAFKSERAGQPVLNMENIIATNPDIVILLAHSMHEKGLSREDLITPWKKLPISAAKSDSIYIIDKHYAGIPSERVVNFLQDFRGILNDYKTTH